MATKSADTIKLNLRLPKGLHRLLRAQAARHGRSLNNEIIHQLEAYREPEAGDQLPEATALTALFDEVAKIAAKTAVETTMQLLSLRHADAPDVASEPEFRDESLRRRLMDQQPAATDDSKFRRHRPKRID